MGLESGNAEKAPDSTITFFILSMTPQQIIEEFDERKMFEDEGNYSFVRASLISLLEYVEGEMPPVESWGDFLKERKSKIEDYDMEAEREDWEYYIARRDAIASCIAKIREIKDSI